MFEIPKLSQKRGLNCHPGVIECGNYEYDIVNNI